MKLIKVNLGARSKFAVIVIVGTLWRHRFYSVRWREPISVLDVM